VIDPPTIPTAWKRELLKLADYTGGWWMPVVCTGHGVHEPRILCHAYEHAVFGAAYSAPFTTVHQTRRRDAIGVPGWSRESITLVCPSAQCQERHEVSRSRWGTVVDNARSVGRAWLDVAELD
jgi:hypothetical protein